MNLPSDTLIVKPGPAAAARVTTLLVQLETDRCQAMMAGDRERLKQILHPDLIHVHAKGQVDSFDSYFESGGFNVNYANLQRFDDLKVNVFGDAALMTGRQLLEAVRKATGDRVYIDSQVMQVWVLNDTRWQQIAFQTTPTEMSVTPKT
jgi:ketosteroid isomerase-like protein